MVSESCPLLSGILFGTEAEAVIVEARLMTSIIKIPSSRNKLHVTDKTIQFSYLRLRQNTTTHLINQNLGFLFPSWRIHISIFRFEDVLCEKGLEYVRQVEPPSMLKYSYVYHTAYPHDRYHLYIDTLVPYDKPGQDLQP
jgi:hypothetical protein